MTEPVLRVLASDVVTCPRPHLTKQELEAVNHLNIGCSNREVAQRLDNSVSTVRQHLHSVSTKLGASPAPPLCESPTISTSIEPAWRCFERSLVTTPKARKGPDNRGIPSTTSVRRSDGAHAPTQPQTDVAKRILGIVQRLAAPKRQRSVDFAADTQGGMLAPLDPLSRFRIPVRRTVSERPAASSRGGEWRVTVPTSGLFI